MFVCLLLLLLFFSGEFSFFAVFDASDFDYISAVIGELGSGIPNKTKFVVGFSRERKITEAIQVSYDFFRFSTLLEILNKRWQTLDLVSMVQELKRRNYLRPPRSLHPISIKNTLSSLPVFKRTEDLS